MKLTNIKLHAIATILVFWFVWLIYCQANFSDKSVIDNRQRLFLAFMVALLWAVNPFQVSTVSYVIQRMTILSAIFVFSGLIFYLKLASQNSIQSIKRLLWLSFGIGICTILAILSKENGVLLLILVWLTDRVLNNNTISQDKADLVTSAWRAIFLLAPTILLFVFLWVKYVHTEGAYDIRDFSLSERLLTQIRIIVIYLQGILLPSVANSGLFSFNQEYSTGLFQPLSTFFCLIFMLFLFSFSLYIRKSYPLISYGLFFYFFGHLIESTFIPLEMYFEHRNYLPQLGLWLAICEGARALIVQYRLSTILLIPVLLLVPLVYSVISFGKSMEWGDPLLQADSWYKDSKASVRTTLQYSFELADQGEPHKAATILDSGILSYPDSLALMLSKSIIECRLYYQGFNQNEFQDVAYKSPLETASVEAIEKLSHIIESGDTCQGLSYEALRSLVTALINNPYYAANKTTLSALYVTQARLFFKERNLNGVMSSLDSACNNKCRPDLRIQQAEILMSAGLFEDAQRYLDMAISMMKESSLHSIKNPTLEARIKQLSALLKQNLKATIGQN